MNMENKNDTKVSNFNNNSFKIEKIYTKYNIEEYSRE
jgi:hypothetical protein